VTPVTLDVEAFIADNNLDMRASESLRVSAPKVQQVVMARGSLADCQKPSAVVLCRIKDAEKGIHSLGGGAGPVDPQQVEQFISENQLDDRASDSLRTCSAIVQKLVMNRKLPPDATSTSGVVMGRIRDAKAARAKADANMGNNMGGGGGGCGGGGAQDMMAMMGGMMGMMQGMMGAQQQAQQAAPAYQQPMASNMAGMYVDVEGFIASNMLDPLAAESLRTCEPDVQAAVMSPTSGGLNDCRNPSAVLLARIKVAKMKQRVSGTPGGGGNPMQQQMEMQMQQQQQAQMQAMQQQQQQEQMQAASAVEVTPQELYQFIVMNGLDERASEALQGCPPEVQRIVMDKGDLSTSRNASGSCMGRIRDARQEVSGGGAGMGGNMGGNAAGGQNAMMDMMKGMMGMMMATQGGGGGFGGAGGNAGGRSGPY